MNNAFWLYLVAGIALFLIGTNLALIYRFWPEPWFIVKLVAAMALLAFVALSVVVEEPHTWLVVVGGCVVALDAGALIGIWDGLRGARGGDGSLVAYRRR